MTDQYVQDLVREIRETFNIDKDDIEFNRRAGTEVLKHVLQLRAIDKWIELATDKVGVIVGDFLLHKDKIDATNTKTFGALTGALPGNAIKPNVIYIKNNMNPSTDDTTNDNSQQWFWAQYDE